MNTYNGNWLVVDDHAMFADALAITLSMLRPGLNVDIAITATDVIARLGHQEYELVILDLQIPETSCTDLFQHLTQAGAEKIMICSAIFQPQQADALRKLGVRGYITKESEAMDILSFADRILHGEDWVCTPRYAKQLAQFEQQKLLLTERQYSILELLEKGATTKQVADTLCLSENTIKTHIRMMYEKLGASSRTDCLLKAKELNLL
ncbi:response regulator transcription factor [Maribrevibacterium harenarium]|uniref:Response regulator transcription factor n=1 Tax=Maribrevibacterium harenarium TaxID=2589817 RepID=A0A501X4F5_9GAMM|nr:response regulator transcription factor [Maribrevibacterium harenarium]TPE55331.1 response regulator transcription factor [Maribrevibacterium harenarium]